MTVPSIPASAPAIPLSLTGADVATYRLLSPSGTVIASGYTKDGWHQTGTPILAFPSPPSPGEYQLAYKEACKDGVAQNPPLDVQVPLVVTAAVPLPIEVGTIETFNRSVQTKQIFTYSGGCFVTIEYVSLDVQLHLAAEQEPFRAVTSYALSIDGKDAGIIGLSSKLGPTTIPLTTLHAPCDGVDHQTGGLSLGTHTMSVKTHIAGAKTDTAETTTSFELLCTTAPAASGATPADGGAAPVSKDDEGGCRLASSSELPLFPAFALATLVVLRRRRKRHG